MRPTFDVRTLTVASLFNHFQKGFAMRDDTMTIEDLIDMMDSIQDA